MKYSNKQQNKKKEKGGGRKKKRSDQGPGRRSENDLERSIQSGAPFGVRGEKERPDQIRNDSKFQTVRIMSIISVGYSTKIEARGRCFTAGERYRVIWLFCFSAERIK